jgi:osmosensitive K+ channel His kinase sensor protein
MADMATDNPPPRGKLRVYLGAEPGVGKTYAMLSEAQRRRARGSDVMAAVVVTHGRPRTAAMAQAVETVPLRPYHRASAFREMDLDAALARHQQVALVDELAHTNVPGCRNAKRWQDVDELLDAGIDVITTLNIQHLESLHDVAQLITGVEQHETLPDEIARRADQVELVDMTPEALRRRMVHGNVCPPDRIEAALTRYFRSGNLTALRQLALLWVADRVEGRGGAAALPGPARYCRAVGDPGADHRRHRRRGRRRDRDPPRGQDCRPHVHGPRRRRRPRQMPPRYAHDPRGPCAIRETPQRPSRRGRRRPREPRAAESAVQATARESSGMAMWLPHRLARGCHPSAPSSSGSRRLLTV